MTKRGWLASFLLLVAVLLIGTGIAGIVRVSYMQHPSWALVILPPVEVIIGTALLIITLLRRMSRELSEQEYSDRHLSKTKPPRQPR